MRNKDIIIQKSDKGNTVVITDQEKYIEGYLRFKKICPIEYYTRQIPQLYHKRQENI